ncbi:alpha-hydroxy-acid oxidizing protein [Roseomonas hellenica]|uniref:Alpha-hydroxy-acid oxidizing protein n=1 Tax=Plastoroseomonas hellenica TaxID=2687306 RepID=A0ABS5F0C3_9PROT|nr:alpha-hydroxy acid oxidase [Plastoroseomonas hellenica]MBR0665979.1 alpha-hydroxy-acid oxidizing protein [Plastoroseomonas hellenica]
MTTSKQEQRLQRRYLSLDDFEAAARRRLPRILYGYISGGVETDASLRDNRDAFAEWGFLPRVLKDVAQRSTATSLFGQAHALPFGIAPMGASAMSGYRADLVYARAAKELGMPMILSGASLIRLEEVQAVGAASWYQAYLPGDPAKIGALVDRVARAGYDTFVLTVDVQVPGNRENNFRNGYRLPLRPGPRLAWQGLTHPRWLFGTGLRTLLRHGVPHFENMEATRSGPVLSARGNPADWTRADLTWAHVAEIRARWQGRFLLKGILAAEDAHIAREHGVDGVIVSNHGGRQLDGTISPLRALPGVAAAAGDMTVIYDGGIRRGSDLLKAYAFGAQFVFLARPFLYAAAAEGLAGVRHAARLLQAEIMRNMAMLGIVRPAEMTPALLMRLGGRDPDRASFGADPVLVEGARAPVRAYP